MIIACFAILLNNASLQADESVGGPKKNVRTITLAEAQKMAAKRNPGMKNVNETVRQADLTIWKAWTMLGPSLKGTGSVTRNKEEIAFPAIIPIDTGTPGLYQIEAMEVVIQEEWGTTFGFSANMSLFNPRSIPLIKNAYDNADRTHLLVKKQKNEFMFAVTSAYYQVSSMKEMIRVEEENVAMSQKSFILSEASLRAGQTTRIDVLRSETQLMDAKKHLEEARDAHEMAKSALAHLIDLREDFQVVEPQQVSYVQGTVQDLTERALQDRVELKEAVLAKTMANRSKTDTWMKWLPKFDVTYAWDWASAAGFQGGNEMWRVIFGASWSLFEGGGRIVDLKLHDVDKRMKDNDLHQLALDIRKEVEQGVLDVNKRLRSIEMADKQIALSKTNHELVSRQYQVGLATGLDLSFASTELANRKIARVIEQLQYDIALLSLRKALGEYHSLADVPG